MHFEKKKKRLNLRCYLKSYVGEIVLVGVKYKISLVLSPDSLNKSFFICKICKYYENDSSQISLDLNNTLSSVLVKQAQNCLIFFMNYPHK